MAWPNGPIGPDAIKLLDCPGTLQNILWFLLNELESDYYITTKSGLYPPIEDAVAWIPYIADDDDDDDDDDDEPRQHFVFGLSSAKLALLEKILRLQRGLFGDTGVPGWLTAEWVLHNVVMLICKHPTVFLQRQMVYEPNPQDVLMFLGDFYSGADGAKLCSELLLLLDTTPTFLAGLYPQSLLLTAFLNPDDIDASDIPDWLSPKALLEHATIHASLALCSVPDHGWPRPFDGAVDVPIPVGIMRHRSLMRAFQEALELSLRRLRNVVRCFERQERPAAEFFTHPPYLQAQAEFKSLVHAVGHVLVASARSAWSLLDTQDTSGGIRHSLYTWLYSELDSALDAMHTLMAREEFVDMDPFLRLFVWVRQHRTYERQANAGFFGVTRRWLRRNHNVISIERHTAPWKIASVLLTSPLASIILALENDPTLVYLSRNSNMVYSAIWLGRALCQTAKGRAIMTRTLDFGPVRIPYGRSDPYASDVWRKLLDAPQPLYQPLVL